MANDEDQYNDNGELILFHGLVDGGKEIKDKLDGDPKIG